MVTTDRCYVICHMMTTIEGKIASGIKGVNLFDEYYNLYSQTEHELKPQAWMCGRVTSAEFAESVDTPLPKTETEIQLTDFRSSTEGSAFMVAVDTKGILRWKTNVLTFGDQSTHQLIIIVTHQTPKEYLTYLQKKDISYIFAGEKDINFVTLFKKLKHSFKIDTLALEGGGRLNGSAMAADMVDEISVLVTPLVLNKSSAPVMFERNIEESINVKRYKLFEVKQRENDCVRLRYKK